MAYNEPPNGYWQPLFQWPTYYFPYAPAPAPIKFTVTTGADTGDDEGDEFSWPEDAAAIVEALKLHGRVRVTKAP